MNLADMKLRSRFQTYSLLIGVVIGMLTAGLGIPLVFADRASTIATGPSDSGGGGGLTEGAGVPTDAAAATADTQAGPGGAAGTGAARGAAGAGSRGGGVTAGAPGQKSTATGPPIRVGALLLDLANVARLGFDNPTASVQDQQKVFQYLFNEVNAAGGIHGRPLEGRYRSYDPLSEESMRQACLDLTQTQDVFAAVDSAGFVGNPILCFTQENNTPFVMAGSSGVPQEYYGLSKGLLFSAFQGSERGMRNLAFEADRTGALKGKKIGIISDLRSGPESVSITLEKALEAMGHQVVHRSVFSADYATGSGQIPVEVQQMSAKGVQVVMNITNALFIAQFTQEAESQRFFPKYFSGDWNGANSDFYYSNVASSFDGSLNFTVGRSNEWRNAQFKETPADARCAAQASKALGRTVPRNSSDYGSFTRTCAIVEYLVVGLRRAGADLSPSSFSNGLRSAGILDVSYFGGAAFTNRFDAADAVRTMRWRADCKCVTPIDDFRPSKY